MQAQELTKQQSLASNASVNEGLIPAEHGPQTPRLKAMGTAAGWAMLQSRIQAGTQDEAHSPAAPTSPG